MLITATSFVGYIYPYKFVLKIGNKLTDCEYEFTEKTWYHITVAYSKLRYQVPASSSFFVTQEHEGNQLMTHSTLSSPRR